MSQYGWRIGSVAAGALALVVAARMGWQAAYIACAIFALPAMAVGLLLGEPARHREPIIRRGLSAVTDSVLAPLLGRLQELADGATATGGRRVELGPTVVAAQQL